MWFDELKYGIEWFSNLKLVYIGGSVTAGCVLLLILFSKTSFGKKVINKFVAEITLMFNTLKKWVEDKLSAFDKRIEEYKKYYEEALEIVKYQNERTTKLLIAISEHINNKQVKELVAKYCEESQKVIGIADVVDDKIIEAKKEAVQELDSVVKDYKDQLRVEFEFEKAKYLEEFERKQAEWQAEINKYKELAETKVNESVNEAIEKVEETMDVAVDTVNEAMDTANGVIENVEKEITEITEE